MTDGHPSRALFQDALAGRINRRELLQRAAALGLTAPVVGALMHASSRAALAQSVEGTLTPTYYDWIDNNHGDAIDKVNEDFARTFPIDAKIAPSAAFSIDVFVEEARDKTSSYDLYLGTTPFVEMASLIQADAIEPWDPYIPADVLNDIIPSIREECSVDGQLYTWPFLLDVIVQGWNADIVQRAELDPEAAPQTWDEFLANARKVKETGAAPFGCTFDARGWRSLAPIAHSFNTDVYENGLFNFTSDAAVSALEVMKQMTELANPDVFNEGTSDGGVNQTPDEGAFAAQQAAYYVKYQNAPLRMSGNWPDPSKLRLAALPKAGETGTGATVFWDTGATLLKYGKNKQQAADYMRLLTYDQRIWENSIGNAATAGGQLPVYNSLWQGWTTNRPAWMTDWAFLVFDKLKDSKAIATSTFGVTQFVIGKPHWETYLKGEVSDPRQALQAAKDAVMAEAANSGLATPAG